MMKYKYREELHFPVGDQKLSGELAIPENCTAIVIFSHGSGSSRFSPRNYYVAEVLHKSGIGTFLFDLLTREEDLAYSNRFDIDLLTSRLVIATTFLQDLKHAGKYPFGYFGASTGAASAIKAAVKLPELIHAVVSRGGRPDLAMKEALKLTAPTLLIVGELDYDVLELNEKVYENLRCEKELEIVTGATHLFEEPGALDQAARLASDWFASHLGVKKVKSLIE